VEAAQRTRSPVRVLVHGEVPDAFAPTLQALDARGVCELRGTFATDELESVLTGVDVAVLPSMWWDCAPLAAAECLAARVPLVVPRLGGLAESVRDGVDGLVVDPLSVGALAGALDRLSSEPGLLEGLQAGILPPHRFETAQSGASTLWLRDRLRTLHAYGALAAPPRVITVDIDLDAARYNVGVRDPGWAESISFVEGDVCDPAVRAEVQTHIACGASCIVIEDSAHVYATTKAALELYSDLIAPGGFFVVEDGCVDVPWMRIKDDWPEGVLPAFRVRRELEVYGVSCHPRGFLQRVS
jgi:hypothetical protein